MLLSCKVPHNLDLTTQLAQAKQVAIFAIANRNKLSSKYVKHLGLPSAIANQILLKYGSDLECRQIRRIKLIIPNQAIKHNSLSQMITIPCLSVKFRYDYSREFLKINQIEIDEKFFYVSGTVRERLPLLTENFLGVDLNSKGHCAVISIPQTGKVHKIGKKAHQIKKQYKNIRRRLQKEKKYKELERIRRREYRIIKDLNHKISRYVVNLARQQGLGIKLEDLTGIRKNRTLKGKTKKVQEHNHTLNSWSFHQLREMIKYKAKLLGIPVSMIHPANTSSHCSKCNQEGIRKGKTFRCPHCGHKDHADANAGFRIALAPGLPLSLPKKKRQRINLKKKATDASTDDAKSSKVARENSRSVINSSVLGSKILLKSRKLVGAGHLLDRDGNEESTDASMDKLSEGQRESKNPTAKAVGVRQL